MSGKEQAARELIEHHFSIEPDLSAVYRILSDNEASSSEPIRLLEVNAATIATGSVEVFQFGPSHKLPFPVEIAEITPKELEYLKNNPQALPAGWSLSTAELFERPTAAE